MKAFQRGKRQAFFKGEKGWGEEDRAVDETGLVRDVSLLWYRGLHVP